MQDAADGRYTGLVKIGMPLLLLLAFCIAIYPSLGAGLTADDYVHLVEDQNRAWYSSSDFLYRPLRNGLLKVLPHVFGTVGAGYRYLIAMTYLGVALLYWRFARLMGSGLPAAWIAVAYAFLSPRNDGLLFWFGTYQDLIVAACFLAAAFAWYRFCRAPEGSREASLHQGVAVLLYGLAIGTKETAAVLPVLLAICHWQWRKPGAGVRKLTIRPYLAFALPAAVFGAFVFWYPDGQFRLDAGETKSIYRQGGAGTILWAEIRAFAQAIDPWGGTLVFRNPKPAVIAEAAAAGLVAALSFLLSRDRTIWFWAIGWAAVASLPSCVFASSSPAGYYVFVAQMAVAIAFLRSLEGLRAGRFRIALLAGVFVLATVAGTWQLNGHAQSWRHAGAEADRVADTVERFLPRDFGGDLFLTGVPHNGGGKPILNNGTRGLLASRGFRDVKVHVLHENGGSSMPALGELRPVLAACRDTAGSESVAVIDMAGPQSYRGGCAAEAAEANRKKYPEAWQEPASQRP